MSSYSTIRGNLRDDLQAVVDAGSSPVADLKYGHGRSDFAGFPAIRYYFDGVENELLAGGGAGSSYRRGYRFKIEIHQEKNAKDAEAAEDALGAAVDAVMDSLEANWNLGTANDMLNAPGSESIKQEQAEPGNTIIIPILVTARTIHSHAS